MRHGGTLNADGYGLGWYTEDPPTADDLPAYTAAAPHDLASTGPAVGNHGAAGGAVVGDRGAGGGAAAGDESASAGAVAGDHQTSAAVHQGAAAAPSSVSHETRRRRPVRYRRNVPIWADQNLAELAGSIRAGGVLAAVRNGTMGMPYGEGAVAPFRSGEWLFSHNGRVPGWPESVVKLAEQLPAADLLGLDAPVDSAFIFALIRHRMGARDDHEAAVAAVTSVVRDVEATAPGSRLNFLLTNGTHLIATTWTHSLHVRRTHNSITLASEPFGEEPGWSEVPDRMLLVATATTLQLTPMEGSA
ncbi:class II glutamine amidotransferase [Kribbella hippodromi]